MRMSDWSSDVCSSVLVEPHRGVAVAGKVAMDLGVARRVLVVLPVRQDLKDRGDRLLMRSFRQPELGGQPNTVRKRNPAVFCLREAAGKFFSYSHRSGVLESQSPACELLRAVERFGRRSSASWRERVCQYV